MSKNKFSWWLFAKNWYATEASAKIYMLNPFLARNTPNFKKKNRKIDFWGWYQHISRQPPRWHVNWSKTTHYTCDCFTIANDSNWLFDLWNFAKIWHCHFFRNKTLLAIKGWKISSEKITKKYSIFRHLTRKETL